jgi:hypothetical protein
MFFYPLHEMIIIDIFLTTFDIKIWKMLDLQHQYNNCTTILHMRVGLTYWGSPSCDGLLCSCCIDVVQESNPLKYIESDRDKIIGMICFIFELEFYSMSLGLYYLN